MQQFALIAVCLTLGGSAGGCATTNLTEAEMIQLQHEQEDRRLVRRDELIDFLNACDASPRLVIVEMIRVSRSTLPNSRQKTKARREYGYPYTHSNVSRRAMRSDVRCMDPRQLMRDLGFE